MSQEECTSTRPGMWAGLREAFPNLVVYLDLSGTYCILSVWPVHIAFKAAHVIEHAASKESVWQPSQSLRDLDLFSYSPNQCNIAMSFLWLALDMVKNSNAERKP